jgi:hypothetical protein
VAVALLGLSIGSSTIATAQEHGPDMAVLVVENRILGNAWPAGASVTVTVDDPDTPESPDYTATEMVVGDPVHGPQVFFPLRDAFRVRPGHIVTLSDDITFKEHVVTNLTVTAGDMASDRIWGTAEPDSSIEVILFSDHSRFRRETADANGNWLADFSIRGDEAGEEAIYDVGADTILMVIQNDDDFDKTQIDWREPLIMAHLIDYAHGFFWPCGASLKVTIDDPATRQSPDYEETQVVAEYCHRDNEVLFDLLQQGFDLKPGQTITMTDGIITKTHLVRDLAFSLVNAHTDMVTGRAGPGTEVGVNVYAEEPHPGHLLVSANEDGVWKADFSSLYDIVPGTSLNIGQGDEDGDWTQDEFGSVLAIEILSVGERNPINPRSHARMLVAILATDTSDPTAVDLTYSSVRFGATGTEAAPVKFAWRDVDRDGDTDLLLHFNTQDTGTECGDTFAYLAIISTWHHLDNMGCVPIQTVGCGRR